MTSGTPLDMSAIQALLDSEKTRAPRQTSAQAQSPHARPIQVGLLGWSDEHKPCVSRNCTSPTLVRVNGVPYCTSHALNQLNLLAMKLDGTREKYNIDSCDCKAGKYSYMNIHTEGCPVYELIKDERDSASSSIGTL